MDVRRVWPVEGMLRYGRLHGSSDRTSAHCVFLRYGLLLQQANIGADVRSEASRER